LQEVLGSTAQRASTGAADGARHEARTHHSTARAVMTELAYCGRPLYGADGQVALDQILTVIRVEVAGPGRGGGPGPALEETYDFLSVRQAERVTRSSMAGPGPIPIRRGIRLARRDG
jgi:hypothetical protein